ncbi:MAG: glycosyltransferase [Blastocatellia bacterium]|nr:glycosyltransferase [Blastocatellia bacterium]
MKRHLARFKQGIARAKRLVWRVNSIGSVLEHVEHLRRDVTALRNENEQLRQLVASQSGSLRWMVEEALRTRAPQAAAVSDLTVSVIMPTWNRADVIERALRSILAQTWTKWECIIVDDGSEDDTEARVRGYLADPRFQYLRLPHRNVSVARNQGLARAKGEIIAYLDTDNVWYPEYLARVVEAFEKDPGVESVYAAQLVERMEPPSSHVRCEPFDLARLRRENFIDMNVFSHRRRMVEAHGGFDERMESMTDWDLILRYAEEGPIQRILDLGGIYTYGRPDQITHRRSGHYSRHQIREKQRQRMPAPTRPPARVLYALWHYPQLSESYVRTEIRAALKKGVEVEAWSQEDVAAPYESEVEVHRGSLAAAIERFQPEVIHTHWLNMAGQILDASQESGLPMTVRAHGFEYYPDLAMHLESFPRLRALFMFPHQIAKCHTVGEKMIPLNAMFRPDLYYPAPKDRRLVMRTGTGLMTKDYQAFMRAAQLCPDHRFLLILCRAYMKESVTDELVRMNEEMGSPVEIKINVQHEEVAQWMRRAGIYLHTFDPQEPFGMSISIAEALATGAYVIARRMPEVEIYLDGAGAVYETAEEAAALIRRTTAWNDRDWERASVRSLDRAWSSFVSDDLIQPIVDCWAGLSK